VTKLRRRRRRQGMIGGIVVALVVASGALWAASSLGGTSHQKVVTSPGRSHPPPTAPSRIATSRQVAAFVTRANKGVAGAFSETYSVSARRGGGSVQITAAQRARNDWVYRETPSLQNDSASGAAVYATYAVYERPDGLYSCSLPHGTGARWSCVGPYKGIGMSETAGLTGPYPPQDLLSGLQNNVEVYSGHAGPKSTPEPAHLLHKKVEGRAVTCLAFGTLPHPLGEVCIDASGVIVSYRFPESASATLVSFAPNPPSRLFAFPASPVEAPNGS
jgi:hypothetical protein